MGCGVYRRSRLSSLLIATYHSAHTPAKPSFATFFDPARYYNLEGQLFLLFSFPQSGHIDGGEAKIRADTALAVASFRDTSRVGRW